MARFSKGMDRSRFAGTSQRSRYACACCCRANGLSGVVSTVAWLAGLGELELPASEMILCRNEGMPINAASAAAIAVTAAIVNFRFCALAPVDAGGLVSFGAGAGDLNAAAPAAAEIECPAACLRSRTISEALW